MAVAKSVRADSDMRRLRLVWNDVDESGAQHSVDDLRNLELGDYQPLGDLVQVSFTIDHGQHFPLSWQKVDERLGTIIERCKARGHAGIRDLVGHARPLVDAARAFHEQRLRADAYGYVLPHRPRRLLGEGEESLRPGHQIEYDRLDLLAHEAVDVAGRDDAMRNQDFADASLVTR